MPVSAAAGGGAAAGGAAACVAAYAFVWVALLVYVWSLWRRLAGRAGAGDCSAAMPAAVGRRTRMGET